MPPKSTRPKLPKRSAGLVISPPAPRPPDDNPSLQIFREAKEAEGQPPNLTPATTHPPPTTHHPPPNHTVAPSRDFARVANSITRDALPSGLFRGESKKLYDALYLRTRGGVVPRRSVRATQAELMDWASVSHNTLKAHLKHLSKVGLLKIHYVRGDNTGAEYEVFLPEETLPPTTHHPPTNQGPPTSQNLAPPTTQNLVLGGGGQPSVSSTVYEEDKTSFKTNTERTDDDEAFGRLRAAAKEITGREAADHQWDELFDVLVTELKIAAGRTTISSVPAFLAEHLRRRLWKKDKRQIFEERKAENPDSAIHKLVDASKCPDCFGAGMYYPEGYEKGVARCRHEKLTTTPGE